MVVIDDYLNDKQLKDFCERLFEWRFQSILEDPVQSVDFRRNRTMIEAKMLVTNLIIALKIVSYTILALYFTGHYWYCFSLIFFSWNDYTEVSNFFVET